MRFRALTFDCYGTLVDWDTGIGAWLTAWAERHGMPADADDLRGRFARFQRERQAAQVFACYRDVLAGALHDVAASHGARASDEDAAAFAASASTWPPFPDTVAALATLKAQGRTLAVVSNIDRDLFAGTAGLLGGHIDLVVTADEVRSYKPGHAHFDALLARLAERGIARQEVLHVAQSRFHDIAPARELGLPCCWVDRRHGRPGQGVTVASDAVPDHRVTSMAGLVDLLGDLDPA